MPTEPGTVQLSGKEKIVGSLLLLAIILPALYFSFAPELRRQSERKTLLAEGQDATATIVSLADTGNTFNDNPEVEIRLVVHPEGAEDFQVDINQVIGAVELANYRAGAEVTVKFDPADHAKVAIISVLAPAAGAQPPPSSAQPEQPN